ncbi:MAG: hypothetical protein EA427_04975 [Spirochaetaceae bacterium]|nr:MAG: hypothetical protein EA427_04975 [Spirochaetaceae bacterium]
MFAGTLALLVLFAVAFPAPAPAQSNPFLGGDAAPGTDNDGAEGNGEGAATAPSGLGLDTAAEFSPPRTALGAWLRDAQRGLTRNLSTTLRAVQRGETTGMFWLIVSLAFIYGVVHSILPGHRKILLVSYFLARDARPITGVIAGIALAAVHAAAAVIVVLVAYYVVRTSVGATVVRAGAAVQTVTAGLVLVAGVVLLVLTIREIRSHRRDDHDGHHHDGHHHDGHGHDGHGHGADPEKARSQRLLPVIVISGLVPCPGSSMIMLFAVSVGVVTLGLIAVASFAVGMALVFAALCVATILVKDRINRLLESRRGAALHHAIEIGGALVMVSFGLFLMAPVIL